MKVQRAEHAYMLFDEESETYYLHVKAEGSVVLLRSEDGVKWKPITSDSTRTKVVNALWSHVSGIEF
jgi:hypothetical protein